MTFTFDFWTKALTCWLDTRHQLQKEGRKKGTRQLRTIQRTLGILRRNFLPKHQHHRTASFGKRVNNMCWNFEQVVKMFPIFVESRRPFPLSDPVKSYLWPQCDQLAWLKRASSLQRGKRSKSLNWRAHDNRLICSAYRRHTARDVLLFFISELKSIFGNKTDSFLSRSFFFFLSNRDWSHSGNEKHAKQTICQKYKLAEKLDVTWGGRETEQFHTRMWSLSHLLAAATTKNDDNDDVKGTRTHGERERDNFRKHSSPVRTAV